MFINFCKKLIVFAFLFSFSFAVENSELANDLAKKLPVWVYPYPHMIDYLNERGESSILIFSYGSLMDKKSAAITLSPKSMRTRKPAVAYGIRRTFDRDIKVQTLTKWQTPYDPKARGMLNVAKEEGGFANGVLAEVSIEDIPKVLSREIGYNLIPVVVQDWKDFIQNKSKYEVAYTFHAPQNSAYTSRDIHPRPGYYELTRNAAQKFGPLFYFIWLKTTYLADGETAIAEWEKEVQKGSLKTKAH